MLIYCAYNTITGKRYIGLTTLTLKSRWRSHVFRANGGKSHSVLHLAIKKYGSEAFVIEEIASLIDGSSVEDLQNLEKTLIAQEGTKIPFGYNMTDGGDSTHGYKFTHEQISKRKLHKISDSTKEKMSASHKARMTEDRLNKMREVRNARWSKTAAEREAKKRAIAEKRNAKKASVSLRKERQAYLKSELGIEEKRKKNALRMSEQNKRVFAGKPGNRKGAKMSAASKQKMRDSRKAYFDRLKTPVLKLVS